MTLSGYFRHYDSQSFFAEPPPPLSISVSARRIEVADFAEIQIRPLYELISRQPILFRQLRPRQLQLSPLSPPFFAISEYEYFRLRAAASRQRHAAADDDAAPAPMIEATAFAES